MSRRGTGDVSASVASYLERRTGLNFTGSGGRRLHDVLDASLRGSGRAAPETGVVSEDAFERLCEKLTVQESYFFREPGKLAIVRDHVLATHAPGRQPLRVWSAGCATGEEPYTLAALCQEAGLGGRYRILGTDLSPAAIDEAREGCYSRWSVRGMDPTRVAELFDKAGSRFRVVDRLRENVSFARHNLMDPRPPEWGQFDVVMCRNVLIYLTPEATHAALTTFREALVTGGWLVLGASDPLADTFPGLEAVLTNYGLAYRRRP
jgi:chemotaxis protein methyltransferase CheR